MHAPVAELTFLPVIDLKPTDESCVLSTLLFVQEQAKRCHSSQALITFDQPLYVKAVDITRANNLVVICRLGGFHTLMNYIGAVGDVMLGSGLENVLELLYCSNTLEYVLTGKAFA